MVAVMALTVAVRVVAESNQAARSLLHVPHADTRVTSLGVGGSRHDAGQVASITSQYCAPIPSC